MSSRSCNQQFCCSCKYWEGKRVIDSTGSFYDALDDKGRCAGPPRGRFKGSETSEDSSCSDWKSNTHPIILTYKETNQNSNGFSVILVIGREPNSEELVGTEIENFDFRKHNNCSFWNTSFSSIGEINEVNVKKGSNYSASMKNEFEQKNSSFICYADLSYQGISNDKSKSEKEKIRKNLDLSKIKEHIELLFETDFVKDRVELVIFSGIENCGFTDQAIQSAYEICEKSNKPYVYVPFFFGNNTKKIVSSLERYPYKKQIVDIYNQWKCS